MDYKKILSVRIKEHIDMELEDIEALMKIPPRSEMGDYSFPCFQLSKLLRKAPNMIAEELKKKISAEDLEKIDTTGPYLNFFFNKGTFIKKTLEKVLLEKDLYGSSDIGKGKTVVVEYSSPNIAKPFHAGHLFTTAIGNSLYKILSFAGYKCIRVNHLGDWGTRFGKLITAYKRGWADETTLEEEPIDELLRIYVKFHHEAESHSELEDEAKMYFKRLEDGCDEEVQLWSTFKNLSLKEFDKIYKLLNVEFDSYAGESFYGDKMNAVMDEISNKGLLVESNGAKVVMLDEYNLPPCIIKKADGATTYATRDLSAAFYRSKSYNFHKNIYVVGTPQALHFKQVFTTLKLMGNQWSDSCVHVGFGLVKFIDKKLSIRKGDVVFLEDLLKEAVDKTLETMKVREFENKKEIAKKIGIGAVIFAYLKNNRERDMVFDWKEILSFDGETGPYVQYTYALGKSVLRKASEIPRSADYSKLITKEEFELVKLLEGFQNAIFMSIDKNEPSIVTRYIIEVAKAFNKFYNIYSVINAEYDELKEARIKLVEATCQVIKNALNLLGVEVVERI